MWNSSAVHVPYLHVELQICKQGTTKMYSLEVATDTGLSIGDPESVSTIIHFTWK
jgi:hypothetical protein